MSTLLLLLGLDIVSALPLGLCTMGSFSFSLAVDISFWHFSPLFSKKREVRRLYTIQNMPILGVFSHFSSSVQL